MVVASEKQLVIPEWMLADIENEEAIDEFCTRILEEISDEASYPSDEVEPLLMPLLISV